MKLNYKEIISLENLERGLQRTKSNVSPGIDGEVKSQITPKRLSKLHEELANQKYKPTPSKKVGIGKPDGGTRYLSISSQIDKVVQGALLEKLEVILEPEFDDKSFGGRKGLGCHDALKEIKYQWKGIIWIIKVDIEKYFDKIHHEYLLEKLEPYCDQSTIELIRKLLKAGYVDIHNLNDRSVYKEEGIQQGSLISPLLSNLYLHELDIYVKDYLIPFYNKGGARKKDPVYAKRYSLTDKDKEILKEYPALKESILRIKHNEFVKGPKFSAMHATDPVYRRLHYVRYIDDFQLGFIGPRNEALEINAKIQEKLDQMFLKVNQAKSKIYHSNDLGIKFLGMYLRYYSHNIVKRRNDSEEQYKDKVNLVPRLQAQAVTVVHFRAPIDSMLKRLVEKGLAKQRKDGTARGTAFVKYSMLEDEHIVNRFSSIIRGIVNYYSCINKRSDLWKVLAVIRKSCALTLGFKHKINSAARVYAKYGANLKVRNNMGIETATIFYPKSLKTKIDFNTRSNKITYPEVIESEIAKVEGSTKTNLKVANVCEFEGCDQTENLEAHHTNPISNISKRKDLTSFEKALIQRKRKIVMLCKKHHNFLHKRKVLD